MKFKIENIDNGKCVSMDGNIMTIERVVELLNEKTKSVFDGQKKRFAEEIIDAENYCRAEGYKCPFLCEDSRPGQRGELNHSESCPATEAKKYLEGLE